MAMVGVAATTTTVVATMTTTQCEDDENKNSINSGGEHWDQYRNGHSSCTLPSVDVARQMHSTPTSTSASPEDWHQDTGATTAGAMPSC
jgi:hypothetical protein